MTDELMSDRRVRSPSGRRPVAVLAAALVLLGGVAAVVIARQVTVAAPAAPTKGAAPVVVPTSTEAARATAETALAVQPMVQLPAQAAQPQTMTTETAGTVIAVPKPTETTGRWIPEGFPATPEGALGQLRTLDETVMPAADPQVYSRGFRELAEPGAPDPGSTGLWSLLANLRSSSQLPATGPVPGMSASYQVTHGQIKGATSDGRYVVACVLGQFSVGTGGRLISAGVGDCQAMRWTGTQWRIASGVLAAAAPSAWPGSADAVKAGYRELGGG